MIDNFKPKDIERLEKFVQQFPKDLPLALEVRNKEWFDEQEISEALFKFLEHNDVTNIMVDTAQRRNRLHTSLTTPFAFIRYRGANHSSDYSTLHDWIEKVKIWREAGLQKLYLSMHQNVEIELPKLAAILSKD